ncbi:unnamed protein product [Psylliodes chrysocephalus]|uniref:Uncharacterized protein n=1 Tax=Psylliodes chrysocephalus TaxID=3402493 RepID=A0A9P0CY86_9CUCU|nr:unnamed protein product [Psylliodes chrysocephala]
MAGDVDASKSDPTKTSKYCKKSVVNSIVKCITCEGVFHNSCALRIAGLMAVGEKNQVKCCSKYVEVKLGEAELTEGKTSEIMLKLLEAKGDILKGKDEIISGLRAKETLLYTNLELLQEKINYLKKKQKEEKEENKKGQHQQKSDSDKSDKSTKSISSNQTALNSDSKQPLPQQPVLQAGEGHNLSSVKNYSSVLTKHNPQISNRREMFTQQKVNSAVLQARMTNNMREIQQLGGHTQTSDTNNNTNEWQVAKRRSRRFVVGRNEDISQVQAVPKFALFHVTRLTPGTKPEQLKAFLEPNFPGVQCEEHSSRYLEYYTSMKVIIKQDDAKEAWKREAWPNGAVISRFLPKKRMPPTQEDPQSKSPHNQMMS